MNILKLYSVFMRRYALTILINLIDIYHESNFIRHQNIHPLLILYHKRSNHQRFTEF